MAQSFKTCCKLCKINPGLYFCYECQHVLCKKCRSIHDQLLPNHTLSEIDNVDPLGFRDNFLCQDHGQERELFCLTCSGLVCKTCVTTNHKGHDLSDLKQKIAEERKNAQQLLLSLEGNVFALQETQEKYILKLTKSLQKAKQQINDVVNEIMCIISRSKGIEHKRHREIEECQRQNVDKFIQELNDKIRKNFNLYSQMGKLLNEKNPKLFYIGYKRLFPEPEVENQNSIPTEPTDIEIPFLDDSTLFSEISELIKSRTTKDRSCEYCKEREMLVQQLCSTNEELDGVNKRLKEEISQLKEKLKKTEENIKTLTMDRNDMQQFRRNEVIDPPPSSVFTQNDAVISSAALLGHDRNEKGSQTMDLRFEEVDRCGCEKVQINMCIKHGKRFTFYCKCHDIPICDLCKSDHHRCKSDTPIKKAIDKMDWSNIKKQCNKFICEVCSLSNIILQILKIASPATENNSVSPSIGSSKQTGTVTSESFLMTTQTHSIEKIIEIFKQINSHRRNLESSQIADVSSGNIKTKKFLAMHAYKNEIIICIEKIQTVIEQYRRKTDMIEPNYNFDIKLLQTAFTDFVLQLFYRSVSSTLSTISSNCKGLDSVHLRKKLNVKINGDKSEPNISSCTVFQNGQIAVTDPANNQLVFIRNDGEQKNQILKRKPYGIANFLANYYAITLYRGQSVCIIDPDTSEMNEIKFSECGSLGGIALAGNSLIVRVNGCGFYRIDAEGKIIEKIYIDHEDCHMQNVCCTNQKLFFPKCNENKVYCSDFKGNIIWTFQNEKVLQGPVGITVDEQGLVYVTGQYSRNIVVISECGYYFREIFFNLRPCAIHYAVATKQLLVCGFDGQVVLYDVHKGKVDCND